MSPAITPLVRRAILDLLTDIGGEHSHAELTLLLNELGHRVAQRDILDQLVWLSDAKLIFIQKLEQFIVARVLADGRDVADGTFIADGVSRHKTGD